MALKYFSILRQWQELQPVLANYIPSPPISGSLQIVICNQAEIPQKELPRIFEKFYRVPNADPWKQGGTDLGLALVQKLVEQLGGTIQVESSNNLTTFTVNFPKLETLQMINFS